MTRAELAATAGLSVCTVRDIEAGKPATAYALARIARALEANLIELAEHPRLDPVTLGVSWTNRLMACVAVDGRLRIVELRSNGLRRAPSAAARIKLVRSNLARCVAELRPSRVILEGPKRRDLDRPAPGEWLPLRAAMDELGTGGTLAHVADYLMRCSELRPRLGPNPRAALKTADGLRALRPLLGAAAVAYAAARRAIIAGRDAY